jgi:hypothetical protein
MNWLSSSPDRKLMENLWSKLVKIVYAKGKQYNSVNKLKNAIFNVGSSIPLTYLQT